MEAREQEELSDEQIRAVDELLDRINKNAQRLAEDRLMFTKQACVDAEQFLASMEKVLLGNPCYELSVRLTVKRYLVSEELEFDLSGKKPLNETSTTIVTACRDHLEHLLRQAKERDIPALTKSMEKSREGFREPSTEESPSPAS